MLQPDLQIYLQPRMTLNFDLLTLKLGHFVPLPTDCLCQLASKSVHMFASLITEELTLTG